MSENTNGNGQDSVEEVVEQVEAEVTDAAETEPEAEQTIPYSRFSEVIAQREAKQAELDRVARENEFLRQQILQNQNQRQTQLQPVETSQPAPWEKYSDPNTKAWLKAQYEIALEAQKVANKPLLERLERQEKIVEKQEADLFWNSYPKISAEVKQAAEHVFADAQRKGIQIDRTTALIHARGLIEMEKDNASMTAAQASTATQRTVNNAARPAISQGAGPSSKPPQTKARSSADILREIEAEHEAKRR